jgi:EAL domain-containing protein (putative c-di-GMP-specific phosphodiesterase class I)
MLTVAEGVTSEAQRRFLVEQGCPLAQGFHLAKPLVAEEGDGAVAGAGGGNLALSVRFTAH